MKKQIILALTVVTITASGFVNAGEDHADLKVAFTQIASGACQRPSTDRNCSAIVWNLEGYKDFIKKYPLRIDEQTLQFDGSRIYVFAFSDVLIGTFCDGFSHITTKKSSDYYLDLHDTGVMYKMREPAAGMKYSGWVLVSIANPNSISHIQIREGVTDRLSEQFRGTPITKTEAAPSDGEKPSN